MKKIDWLYAGISLLTLFALAAIPKMQFRFDIWVYFPVYFLLTLIVISFKKRPPLAATIAILSGFLIPDILVRLLEGFRDSYISIPRLVFQIIACFTAFVFYSVTTAKKVSLLLCSALLIVLYTSFWQQYWFNFSDYGTLTGKIGKTKIFSWKVLNQNSDTLTQDRYSDKIVLFDFWTTSCAVCFRKFPALEKIYQMHKSQNDVIVEAVNVPLPRDTNNMAFAVMSNKPHTFPVVVGLNGIDSIFGIEVYPTTIVMYNGEIMYKGNIEGAENMINDLRYRK